MKRCKFQNYCRCGLHIFSINRATTFLCDTDSGSDGDEDDGDMVDRYSHSLIHAYTYNFHSAARILNCSQADPAVISTVLESKRVQNSCFWFNLLFSLYVDVSTTYHIPK